jgi:hypothetical protein
MKTRSIILFLLVLVGMADLTFAGGGGMPSTTRGRKMTVTAPTSPTKAPDADGFIQRWLILEPIRVSGGLGDNAVRAAVTTEYFPNQLTVIPRDGDKVTVSGAELAWHAVDTTEFNVDLMHYARAFGKQYENVLFWAVTVIDSPREIPNARLSIGSNAASVWWVNGKEAAALYQNRQSAVDDAVSKRLTIKKGPNVIRAAVINSTGATDFNARLLDADEKPINDFTINLSGAGQ